MKRRAWRLGALVWGLGARAAFGCPCSDDAGSGAGLTRPDEHFAFALLQSARRAHGVFDAQGRYRSRGAGEHEASEELLLRAALRLPARLEWQAELGYAVRRFRAPGVVENSAGWGDVGLRARAELSNEAMPHEAFPWPALAGGAFVRAPLADASGASSRGFGSGGTQFGLGAWELGLTGDASRSLAERLRFSVLLECAYRFEDHVLGRARHLGPRAALELAAGYELGPEVGWSGGARLRWEGNVTLEGRALPGTAQRALSLFTGLSWQRTLANSAFRSGITLSADPPLSRIEVGGVATMALGITLGFAK